MLIDNFNINPHTTLKNLHFHLQWGLCGPRWLFLLKYVFMELTFQSFFYCLHWKEIDSNIYVLMTMLNKNEFLIKLIIFTFVCCPNMPDVINNIHANLKKQLGKATPTKR